MQNYLGNDTTVEELQIFSQHRDLFRTASMNLVKKVFVEYAQGRIVDLGSGIGELSLLASGLHRGIFQTELRHSLAAFAKSNHPDSRIASADIYHLPFPENAFGTAVSLGSADTLPNIETALIEIKRILDKEGKVIHFRDTQAPFYWALSSSSDEIPFPHYETDIEFRKIPGKVMGFLLEIPNF